MVNVEELKKENQEINDVISVLSDLIPNPDLRENPVFCELLKRFSDKVNMHLAHEGRAVYSELLTHGDSEGKEVAAKFMNNTSQLKKFLTDYSRHWCHKPANSGDHEDFVGQTKEIFHLVNERINLETNRLFPIL